ncbi:MAG TPA: DUF3365 domain-containing protein [Polyangiales bacterium]|jgi:hypothetical protein|nr:DUF3365 domain-containing protein [Polyangiales bacterium]
MLRTSILLSLVLALPACERSKIDEAKWKSAGAEAIEPFKKNLKQALVEGLEEGPVKAISVCQVKAPELAEKASSASVEVGRSSNKLRNPANAPKPWMKPFLDRYAEDPDQREPAAVLIDEKTVGYVEPIFVQPLCVTCHGETLAPDLKAKLSELYPNDEATGYEPGDFRGIFWAELARD